MKYPPVVMDFHHVDPSSKEQEVSVLVRCGSMDRLQREVSKCILLCANCHRLEHLVALAA